MMHQQGGNIVNRNFSLRWLAGLGLLLGSLSPAHAALLNPGGTNVGPGDPLATQYALDTAAGPALATTGVINFTGVDALGAVFYTGTLEQVVYRSVASAGNLACPAGGCLDFYYQFHNNTGSADAIARMTTVSFTGFVTDVGTNANAVSLPGIIGTPSATPTSEDRSATGSTIGFSFGTTVTTHVSPGQTTQIVGILTNATAYTLGAT